MILGLFVAQKVALFLLFCTFKNLHRMQTQNLIVFKFGTHKKGHFGTKFDQNWQNY